MAILPIRAVLGLCAVLAAGGGASAQELEDGRTIDPPPSEGPIPIHLGIYVIQISNLDELQQTFDVEGYLTANWFDPRLAFDTVAFGAPRKVYHNEDATGRLGTSQWWPSIEFVSAAGGGTLSRDWLEISGDGTVDFTARFNATVTSQMNLRQFPFDRQRLRIPLESYFSDATVLRFVADSANTGHDETGSLLEWKINDVAIVVDEHDYSQQGEFLGSYSRFNFEIEIIRQWAYYGWKIFLPLLLIVASSWTVFYIRDLSINVSIAFTIMLTVVAFNFAIAGSLPRVPYLTFLDAVLTVCYLSVFLSLILIMVAQRLEARGREAAEEKLKRTCRWVFPGALAVSVAVLALVFFG